MKHILQRDCCNLIVTLNYQRAKIVNFIVSEKVQVSSMNDFALGAAFLDVILAMLFAYLLMRIATSSDHNFYKPFYTFFVVTG